jgi:hypothetical protein
MSTSAKFEDLVYLFDSMKLKVVLDKEEDWMFYKSKKRWEDKEEEISW